MKVAREIFIVILLIAVVIFTLGLMFYSSIPTNKAMPASIEYSSDSDTVATKQKIEETKLTEFEKQLLSDTTSNSDSKQEKEIVLASYTVGVSELSTARNRRLYQSGKSNPFEEYKEEKESSEGNTDGSTGGSNGDSSSEDSSTSGSSSGKLFENTKSK